MNINVLYSDSYPYIITKADGNYNHQAYKLLEAINAKIKDIVEKQSWVNNSMTINYNDTNNTINDVTPTIPNTSSNTNSSTNSSTNTSTNSSTNTSTNSSTNTSIPGGNTPVTPGKITYGIDPVPIDNITPVTPGDILPNTFKIYDKQYVNIQTLNNNVDNNLNIVINEELMKLRLNTVNDDINVKYLSEILASNVFRLLLNNETLTSYKNIIVPKQYLDSLQEYIKVLIASETDKDKLERFIKTVDDNIDIYIIPENTEIKYIKNTTNYNPLIFSLSIPNRIKFNYGWFTPNTNNMVDFYIKDELQDILDVDLLQSNTKIKNIHPLLNYTGNKVFDDTNIYTVNKNYFMIPERSLLSATWDSNYYRKYNTENNYDIKEGHITGIDDKSFFGSRCMVIHNDYIELNKWLYDTANDIFSTKITDSKYNLQTTNVISFELNINLSTALYNFFINNDVFKENWNYFKDSQFTGMKNYITNTISVSYNMNSDIDIKLYYIDTDINEVINIITEKPTNIENYKIYEGYSSQINLKNNIYTLKIILPKSTGMNIYPVIKIYRK